MKSEANPTKHKWTQGTVVDASMNSPALQEKVNARSQLERILLTALLYVARQSNNWLTAVQNVLRFHRIAKDPKRLWLQSPSAHQEQCLLSKVPSQIKVNFLSQCSCCKDGEMAGYRQSAPTCFQDFQDWFSVQCSFSKSTPTTFLRPQRDKSWPSPNHVQNPRIL